MSVEKEDLDSDDLEEPQESESNVWFYPILSSVAFIYISGRQVENWLFFWAITCF